MSCYRQSRFASSLTQHPPEIVFCLTECTIRQHCSARTAVLLATSKHYSSYQPGHRTMCVHWHEDILNPVLVHCAKTKVVDFRWCVTRQFMQSIWRPLPNGPSMCCHCARKETSVTDCAFTCRFNYNHEFIADCSFCLSFVCLVVVVLISPRRESVSNEKTGTKTLDHQMVWY